MKIFKGARYETMERGMDSVELDPLHSIMFDRRGVPLCSLCSWKDCPSSLPLTLNEQN